MAEPKGEMVEIESKDSTYIQQLTRGQGPPKITGRDDPEPGGKR